MTRSGSGRSAREAMQEDRLCAEVEYAGRRRVSGVPPAMQGSRSTRIGLAVEPGDVAYGMMGSKVKRKDVSQLSCLTVSAMVTLRRDAATMLCEGKKEKVLQLPRKFDSGGPSHIALDKKFRRGRSSWCRRK